MTKVQAEGNTSLGMNVQNSRELWQYVFPFITFADFKDKSLFKPLKKRKKKKNVNLFAEVGAQHVKQPAVRVRSCLPCLGWPRGSRYDAALCVTSPTPLGSVQRGASRARRRWPRRQGCASTFCVC